MILQYFRNENFHRYINSFHLISWRVNLYQAQHHVHQPVYHQHLCSLYSKVCQGMSSQCQSYNQRFRCKIKKLNRCNNGRVSGSLSYRLQIYTAHSHQMFHPHIHQYLGNRAYDLYLFLYYLNSIQDHKCISILPVQLEGNLSVLDKDHLVQKIHPVIHTDSISNHCWSFYRIK